MGKIAFWSSLFAITYLQLNKLNKLISLYFDYACCLYPVGLSKEAILVKKDQIRRVKFIGFQDSRFVDLKKELVKENE